MNNATLESCEKSHDWAKKMGSSFVVGKALFKKGRIISAKVFDRSMSMPDYLRAAFPAAWGKRYNLEIRICKGIWQGADFDTLEELEPHLAKHLGLDYSAI